MVANTKQFRTERRITAYVSPTNKKKFTSYRKKLDLPMSRALDMMLTEFFVKGDKKC